MIAHIRIYCKIIYFSKFEFDALDSKLSSQKCNMKKEIICKINYEYVSSILIFMFYCICYYDEIYQTWNSDDFYPI